MRKAIPACVITACALFFAGCGDVVWDLDYSPLGAPDPTPPPPATLENTTWEVTAIQEDLMGTTLTSPFGFDDYPPADYDGDGTEESVIYREYVFYYQGTYGDFIDVIISDGGSNTVSFPLILESAGIEAGRFLVDAADYTVSGNTINMWELAIPFELAGDTLTTALEVEDFLDLDEDGDAAELYTTVTTFRAVASPSIEELISSP